MSETTNVAVALGGGGLDRHVYVPMAGCYQSTVSRGLTLYGPPLLARVAELLFKEPRLTNSIGGHNYYDGRFSGLTAEYAPPSSDASYLVALIRTPLGTDTCPTSLELHVASKQGKSGPWTGLLARFVLRECVASDDGSMREKADFGLDSVTIVRPVRFPVRFLGRIGGREENITVSYGPGGVGPTDADAAWIDDYCRRTINARDAVLQARGLKLNSGGSASGTPADWDGYNSHWGGG